MEVRVYITNLAQYNAGKLVGKWVELPMDEDALRDEVKAVLGHDEELFLTDYEAPFKVEEYDNVYDLNSFAEKLSKLEEYDQERVFFLLDTICLCREEALRSYEDVTFYKGMSLEDVAEELVDEGIFGKIEDNIKCYLDYEKLARDLGIDGYHENDKGVFAYH